MPRRFNYTGRKKINRSDATIRIVNNGQALGFEADLRLSDYGLDPQARLYIEAYRQTLWRRFDFGRVGIQQPPSDRSLTDFGTAEGVLFRVKVSSDHGALGKLLAEAEGIRPLLPDEHEAHRQPLIDTAPADLGGGLWRVSFVGEPQVLVERNIATGWQEFARNPMFRALFAPAVMREVLTRILIIDRDTGDEDNPDDWRVRWINFTKQLAPDVVECPGAVDDSEVTIDSAGEWIDSAVQAFARRSHMFDRFSAFVQPPEVQS